MTWMAAAPAALVCLAVLYLPGIVVLLAARFGLARSVAFGPLVSLAVLLGAALGSSSLGVRWGWEPVAASAVACAIVAALLGLWRSSRRAPRARGEGGSVRARPTGLRGSRLLADVGVLALYGIGTLGMVRVVQPFFLRAIDRPDAIAQRFDAAFHLNVVALIERTGDASPLMIGRLAGTAFYPSGWHQLVSLAAEYSGASAPLAVNACSLIITFVVWPLSVAALVESILRPGIIVRLVTPVLAMGFSAFPWLLYSWGLLYPNILAFSLTPAMVALAVLLTRRTYTRLRDLVCALVAVAVAGSGLLSAHPNAVLTAVLVLAPFFVVRVVQMVRSRAIRRPIALLEALVMVLAVALLPAAWVVLAPPANVAPWHAYQSIPQAIGEALVGGSNGVPVAWAPTVLVVLGLVQLAMTRRSRWMVAATVLLGVVFVACTGAPDGPFRDIVAGPFYRDNFRVAAAMVVVLPVAAAAGVLGLVRLVVGGGRAAREALGNNRPRAASPRARAGARLVGTVVALVVGVVAGQQIAWGTVRSSSFGEALGNVRNAFKLAPDSDLVSTDEHALMVRIPEYVPAGTAIVVDPWQGGGLAYALGARDVTELYMFSPGSNADADVRTIRARLSSVSTDPSVCRALEAEHASYFLQTDGHWVAEVDSSRTYSGFVGIDEHTPGFEAVAREGDVTLYRITACD